MTCPKCQRPKSSLDVHNASRSECFDGVASYLDPWCPVVAEAYQRGLGDAERAGSIAGEEAEGFLAERADESVCEICARESPSLRVCDACQNVKSIPSEVHEALEGCLRHLGKHSSDNEFIMEYAETLHAWIDTLMQPPTEEKPANRWRPIATAPFYDYAHGRLILRAPRDVDEHPHEYIAVLGYRSEDDWHDECGTLSPTHWMPLPSVDLDGGES